MKNVFSARDTEKQSLICDICTSKTGFPTIPKYVKIITDCISFPYTFQYHIMFLESIFEITHVADPPHQLDANAPI